MIILFIFHHYTSFNFSKKSKNRTTHCGFPVSDMKFNDSLPLFLTLAFSGLGNTFWHYRAYAAAWVSPPPAGLGLINTSERVRRQCELKHSHSYSSLGMNQSVQEWSAIFFWEVGELSNGLK
jgi:hypothetical protein